MNRLTSALFAIIALPVAFAHPGGLDANGGHSDRKNGGYHYHRAQPSGATSAPKPAVVAPIASQPAAPKDEKAPAVSLTGKVVSVADGDTITVLTAAKESVKVRFHGIDAPESGQAFGTRAKEELSALVFGKMVTVDVKEKDRYGRTVGRVIVDGVQVNVEMVRRGFAWWYREYAKKDLELATAEAEAKNAKRGLWVEKAPIAPWEFRRTESAKKAKTVTTSRR